MRWIQKDERSYSNNSEVSDFKAKSYDVGMRGSARIYIGSTTSVESVVSYEPSNAARPTPPSTVIALQLSNLYNPFNRILTL
jgi:hypothetical protein